jgi:hypothetical protein
MQEPAEKPNGIESMPFVVRQNRRGAAGDSRDIPEQLT